MFRPIRRNRKRERNSLRLNRYLRDYENPVEMGDDEYIRRRYRFRPQTIYCLCEILSESLGRLTDRSNAVPVIIEIGIALIFFATGSFYIVIGDTMDVSKSTVSRAVRDVSKALAEMLPFFVKFPTGDEVIKSQSKFFEICGFPSVVGCVDCTQVRIQAPIEREEDYVCRKGFHSINVQVICDGFRRIVNVVAKWPGSVHDSRIFRDSVTCQQFEAGEHQGLLLGDSGYPLRPFLMTPFSHPNTPAEEIFNERHILTRSKIWQVNGIWKRVFPCLHGELRVAADRCCSIISACSVLYNIAIEHRNILECEVENIIAANNDLAVDVIPAADDRNDGKLVRNRITRIHMTT